MLESVLDAFELVLRSSQTGLPGGLSALPTGDLGIERKLARGEDLTPGQLPHVYLYDAGSTRTRLEGGSIERTLAIRGELWVERETVEEAWSRIAAIDAELEDDATLGGLVADSLVTEATSERFEARARSRVPFTLAVRWADAPNPGSSTTPATPRVLLATIATAVEALTSTTSLPSELGELEDLAGEVAPGARRYQLLAFPAAYRVRGSNTGRDRVRVRLRVLAALHGDDTERGYVWGLVQTELTQLVRETWWTALAGVREVLDGPTVELSRPAAGAVVAYIVEIDLDVDEGT